MEVAGRGRSSEKYITDSPLVKGSKKVGDASDSIANGLMKIMKTSVGFIEDIHAKIMQASPLLQSVESLFNLAMQLFFMPLGNKLAEVMLPAILNMVDDVMEMWDKIDGMDLGEILTVMIDYGISLLKDYLNNLGSQLSEESGIVGSIGEMLVDMSDWLSLLPGLMKGVVGALGFIFENFETLVTVFIEFKTLSLAMQTIQTLAAISSLGLVGGILAALGVLTVGGITWAATDAWTSNNFASGGYVSETGGGKQVLLGEGGEGEYIVPESKVGQFAKEHGSSSNATYNFYINGYTDSQLRDIIKDTVNEMSNTSVLRRGI